MVPPLHCRRRIALDEAEQVSPAPDEVAFAVEVLARRLAFLRPQLGLLRAYPGQFADDKGTDGIVAEMPGRRDAHAPGRRMDAQVEVFDALAHHLDAEFTQLHAAALNTRSGP